MYGDLEISDFCRKKYQMQSKGQIAFIPCVQVIFDICMQVQKYHMY